jgi:hypothetical protein
MDTLETYRQIIETILIEYTKIPYAHGDIQTETLFDRKNDYCPKISRFQGNRVLSTRLRISGGS